MELNKEQLQILHFLYDHPTKTFSYDQLSQLNIPSILSDTGNLRKKGLIFVTGYNECNYTYKITSEGRAAYEAYLANQDEKDFNVDSTNKALELAEEANVLSKEANVSSERANVLSEKANMTSKKAIKCSVICSVVSILVAIVSFIASCYIQAR